MSFFDSAEVEVEQASLIPRIRVFGVDLERLVEGDLGLLRSVHGDEAGSEVNERHRVSRVALGETAEFCRGLWPICQIHQYLSPPLAGEIEVGVGLDEFVRIV